MMDDLIVGLSNIAKHIGKSRPTTKLLIYSPNLPAYQVNGYWVSTNDLLDRFKKNNMKTQKNGKMQLVEAV